MLTRTAGVELAPHNILVVGVGPGAIATPINLSTMTNPALLGKLDAAIPLGRMAKPEEIATDGLSDCIMCRRVTGLFCQRVRGL